MTLEFILGAFAGLLVCSGRRKFAYPVLAAAAIWLTVAAVVLWPQSEADFPGGWARVAAFGIPSALIVYAIVSLEADGQFTAPQWLIDLGDWSYALYLSHLLVLSAAVRVWASAVPNIGVAGNLAFITLATATCIAAAWASYRFFRDSRSQCHAGDWRQAVHGPAAHRLAGYGEPDLVADTSTRRPAAGLAAPATPEPGCAPRASRRDA